MTDELPFRVSVTLLLVTFVAHRAYYTRRVQHDETATRAQPDLGTATGISALFALLALISTLQYIVLPTWLAWSRLPLPVGIRWLGLAPALAGFGLLQWAQTSLGRNWSDAPKLLARQQLITIGPYRWIRHPIYTAFLLILGSPLLLTANWFIGLSWLLMVSLDVIARVNVEETLLLDEFGPEYRAYMNRTGRLLPKITRG